jgi:predicted DCC family thiol-disulfide oxidoreductase YuxK
VSRSESDVPADCANPSGESSTPESWSINLLYDGACPICSREVALLQKLDRGKGRIRFEDIAGLRPGERAHGRDRETLLDRIHGVLPDGEVIEGVEVFRRAYAAVGLGWLLAPTRWPLLRRVADAGYRWFARNRQRLTGRRAPTPRAGPVETCLVTPDR